MGWHRRARDRDRAARRWRDRGGSRLALDLLAQRADRAHRSPARGLPADGDPRSRWPPRRPGPRSHQRWSASPRVGRHQRQRSRLGQPADRRGARRRRGAAGRVRRLGSAQRACDAADVVLPEPRVQRRESRLAADVLRDVRRRVPARPVLPGRAGLQPVPGRSSDAAVTGMPIIVAPIAGVLADRIGGRPILATGMALQAVALGWLAVVVTPTVPYEAMVVPFILAGIGMGLFFAPIANVVLSAVNADQEGKASGATNTIREVGGVFGAAVLAAIFSPNGDYGTPAAYVARMQPAVAVGAVVVGIGALAALFIPARAGARAIVAHRDDAEIGLSGQVATEPV